MDAIQKIQLDEDHYVEITYYEDPESPRQWGNDSKLCIREHRRYTFPNELDIDFDDLNDNETYYGETPEGKKITCADNEKEKLEGYYVFNLDCYEHSGIAFSISGTGMQCQFDTACKCGLIAMPKLGYTEEQAKACAKQDIEIYNAYLNGEIYSFALYKTFAPVTIEGRNYEADDEYIDGCSGFYDYKSMAEHLPQEYQEKFLSSI